MATQLTRIELLTRMTEALAQQTEQLLSSDQLILNDLAVKLDSVREKVDLIEQELNAPEPQRAATKVQICLTRFSALKGGPILSGTITLTDDHVAHTPIKWADDVGTVPAPADATVVSSDTAIATVAFNSDMTDVDTTPVADGTCTWTVASASLSISDAVTVNVTLPSATGVNADAAGTTFTPKV